MTRTVFIADATSSTQLNGFADLILAAARDVDIRTLCDAELESDERNSPTNARDEDIVTPFHGTIDDHCSDAPYHRKY